MGDDRVDYQSPIVMTAGGRQVVVAAGRKKLFGIDPASGELLWEHEHGGDGSVPGTGSIVPVAAGPDRVLLMDQADTSALFAIGEKEADPAGTVEITEVWRTNALRGSYVPPVFHDGYFYGVSGFILTCVDAATGKPAWKSRQPGDGFLTVVGDHLVILTKAGSLHVARATPEGYDEVAGLELFEDLSWSGVSVAGGRLVARSLGEIALVDVARSTPAQEAETVLAGLPPASSAMGRFVDELAHADDPAAAIDSFLARQSTFPILEFPDLVHFVYRGEAGDVGIVGDMIGDRREDPMHRVAGPGGGTDLFVYSARLEADARLQYRFIKDFGEPLTDPRNPRTEPMPRGPDATAGEMSWFAMPAWSEPDYLAAQPEDGQPASGQPDGGQSDSGQSAAGRIETHTHASAALEGAERTVDVYLPAGYDDGGERYPTVYVMGGGDALSRGHMKRALDRLLGTSVRPLIAVFVHEEGRQMFPEMWGGLKDAHAAMVVDEIVPFVDGRYRTVPEPGSRAVVGAGMPGFGALWIAFSRPEAVGAVGSSSAQMLSSPAGELTALVRTADERPLRIYLDWTTYDLRGPHEAWDMGRDNRELRALLRQRGYRPAGGEAPLGTGWGAWSQRTGEMLRALFPLDAGGG